METSTGITIDVETVGIKTITLSFSVKKLIVVGSTVVTFVSGTLGPFLHSQYQKKLDKIKDQVTAQYELKIKNAEFKSAEADHVQLEFSTVVSQLQSSVDFLKVHTAYNTAYILYSESPDKRNTARYNSIVFTYAQFIKNKRTYPSNAESTSFYLSDTAVYVDGIKYIIPYDVLMTIKDIKSAN